VESNTTEIGSPVHLGSAYQVNYREICTRFLYGGWTLAWNEKQAAPFVYTRTEVIGYDDISSLAMKVSNLNF
jgi:hypothetical protein